MFGGVFFLNEIGALKWAKYVLFWLYSLEKKIFHEIKLFVLNYIISKIKIKAFITKSY